ncbi:MAG: NUDIX domain-containing protein [Bacteroidales bacterium]|nr:NUDIX domain-containing protein [Bacteroidales bacterium]
MVVKDCNGNELVRVIKITENEANKLYIPITHCLAIVMIGNEYLLGWNKWRKDWEIFGGCIEPQETMRQCIMRECFEEIGIRDVQIDYIGVMEFNLCPDYFSSEYR